MMHTELARCEPSRKCRQLGGCARPRLPDDGRDVVDASICLKGANTWCSMFIDTRGMQLLDRAPALEFGGEHVEQRVVKTWAQPVKRGAASVWDLAA